MDHHTTIPENMGHYETPNSRNTTTASSIGNKNQIKQLRKRIEELEERVEELEGEQ